MSLPPRQQRFVDEYLIDLNGKQAAIRAGYAPGSAEVSASRLLSTDKVKARITELTADRNKRTQLTQDEVINDLRELRDICMGRRAITITEVVKNTSEGKADSADLTVKAFEPASAARALELLGKHQGMFSTKVEHSGTLSLESIVAGAGTSE